MESALKRWAEAVLRWGVGGLFIVAGALKVPNPVAFLQAIEGYRILPGWAAPLAAVYLPWLEMACGAGFVLKKGYAGALALVTALTALFIAALLTAWTRGLDIECGCFGADGLSGQLGGALARDVVLLGVLLWLWRRP